MKMGLTIILGGVGGDDTDINPTPSVEDQIIIDEPVVVVPPVVLPEEPPIVVDPTPPVVEVPDTVPEPEPVPEDEVVFEEPPPYVPPVVVEPPPVVVVPSEPAAARTIDDFPQLTVSSPEMFVSFASKPNDSNYTTSEADQDFDFKWQSFNPKSSAISGGKWEIVIPKDEIKKGIHAAKDLAGKNEYYFGYEIEFDNDYDLDGNHGGKLPGMIGLNKSLTNSSGNQVYPDGCNGLGQRRDEGFSLRSMFRKNGRMIGYFYHEDNPEMLPGGNNSCGHEVDYLHEGQKFYVKKGVRYFIETRCKLNSKNAANGIVEIWVNGFKVLSMTGMTLSYSHLYDINHMFIYHWHGGSSSTWEPQNDSTVRYDNFILQTTPIASRIEDE